MTLITHVRASGLGLFISRAVLTDLSILESLTKSEAMEWTNGRVLTEARLLCQRGLVA